MMQFKLHLESPFSFLSNPLFIGLRLIEPITVPADVNFREHYQLLYDWFPFAFDWLPKERKLTLSECVGEGGDSD